MMFYLKEGKIFISLIILSFILTSLLIYIKQADAKKSQFLPLNFKIIAYKNGYTEQDFLNEFTQLNVTATGYYESHYFIPFITTHLQRETILMLPVLRKNNDIEVDLLKNTNSSQLNFRLPLYSKQSGYPIYRLDLNIPPIFANITFDCQRKFPKQSEYIETEKYIALVEFNLKKCRYNRH